MNNITLENTLDHNLKPLKVDNKVLPLNVSENKIVYPKNPTDTYEVVNKKYVDEKTSNSADKFYRSSAFYHGGSNLEYIPLAGGATIEQSTLNDFTVDDTNFICPYNLKINTIYVQATRPSSSSAIAGLTSMRLAKNGTFISSAVQVNMDTIGYDTTDIYTIYTFDFSSETNTYSAGEVMQISIDPTNQIFYVTCTIVGEYT